MEIAQLCKSTYNNHFQQTIYLCLRETVSNMASKHILPEPKLRSHHDAHLHPLINVPTKCQPSSPYGF